MKKSRITLGLFVATLIFTSCNTKSTEKQAKDSAVEQSDSFSPVQINVDSVVRFVDSKRTEIEALNAKPIEISTKQLREKTKQKWSKIHFYTQKNELVKIKTYPYEGISKRTEEFYVNHAKLILVVIEDDGSGPKGKP